MSSSSDFGSRLRQARETRGVSLREIAVKTKISTSALEALERNDISRLPGGIFSRAFVRSYAIEVGLDPEQTVEDFIAQFPHDSVTAGTPHSSQADDNEAIESDRRIAETILKLLLISIPIAGALIYFSNKGWRQAPDAPPPAPPASVSSTTTSIPSEDGAVAAGAVPRAPGEPAAAPAASGRSPAQPLAITVRALAPCWVSASVDGVRRPGRTLQPGEALDLSAASEVVLSAGDGGALAVTINGVEARPLGARGEVVTTRITPRNYKSLLP